MEEQEINKTIAEYMHPRARSAGFNAAISKKYTTSLDACIPVVEKLGFNWWDITKKKQQWFVNKVHLVETEIRYEYHCSFQDSDYGMTGAVAESPALALATALAKAIKEIN